MIFPAHFLNGMLFRRSAVLHWLQLSDLRNTKLYILQIAVPKMPLLSQLFTLVSHTLLPLRKIAKKPDRENTACPDYSDGLTAAHGVRSPVNYNLRLLNSKHCC